MMMRSEKGVSAVEFALIAPLLFVLTFGIVEFALLLFDQAVVTNASREGARAAIVYHAIGPDLEDYDPLDEDGIEDVVMKYANGKDNEGYLVNLGLTGKKLLGRDDIDILYGPTPETAVVGGTPKSEEFVIVRVTYTYVFLVLPNLSKLLEGEFDRLNIPLVGRTVMRME